MKNPCIYSEGSQFGSPQLTSYLWFFTILRTLKPPGLDGQHPWVNWGEILSEWKTLRIFFVGQPNGETLPMETSCQQEGLL